MRTLLETARRKDGRLTGLVLAVLCVGLAGCATVRRAREAQKADRVPAGERTLTAAEAGLSSNSVLTLDEALRISLAYHPAIVQATQAVAAAEAQVGKVRSDYGPTVGGSAGYGRSTSNTKGEPESNSSKSSYSGSVSLNMLLYDFGKTPAAVRQALARLLSAENGLRAARNDAAFNVRSAFYGLGKAQELVQVSEEAVRQYASHLEQVKAYQEVGRRTRYDVTKAEVDLGNAKLQLINAQNDLATARVTLNRRMGLAEEPGYRLGDSPAAEFSGKADELMALARKQHPELRSLQAQESLASAGVDAAIADLYPSLTVRGEYGASGSGFPLTWNWSGAVQSVLDLFSGSRKTGAIDEAVTQLRSARAKKADREQQIYMDLNFALSQLESARQRMDLTALTLRQAGESLELINERYRVGKASSVEVTDAQVAVTGAKADQVKARFEYQTAVAQIKHAIGEE